jgi:hypothetical protein
MIRFLFIFCFLVFTLRLSAETHALIIMGLSGEQAKLQEYTQEVAAWRELFKANKISEDHITVLTSPQSLSEKSETPFRSTIKSHIERWNKELSAQDDAILVLVGYGVTEGKNYHFQIRGPRLTGKDLQQWLEKLPTKSLKVFVTGPGGAGLSEALAAPKRVIFSATSSGNEINETMFGRFFIKEAQSRPKDPIFDIFRKVEEKIAEHYKSQGLARSEYANVRIGTSSPVEAPFHLPVEHASLEKENLGGSMIVAANPKEPSAPPTEAPTPTSSESPTPQQPAPPNPPPAASKDRRIKTRESTPEEKALFKNLPSKTDLQNLDGLVLSKKIKTNITADFSSTELIEYQIYVLHPRIRSSIDSRIVHSGRASSELLRLKTILPNGKTVEVNPRRGSFQHGKDEERDVGGLSFFVPSIQPGCIVDYAVQIENPRPPFSAYYDEIGLQEIIPTRECSISIDYDKKAPMQFKHYGVKPSTENRKESPFAVSYEWTWKNLPAYAIEPNIAHTTITPMLAMTSYKNWNEFFEWAERLMRGTDDTNDELKETAQELSAHCKTDTEKIQAVYDYVANLRYVAIEIGANAFRPHTATSVLAKQYGDCKDKANLIVSLLREMNIPANLVLVARSKSFDDAFPGFQFNHAVAALPRPEGTFWLDATDECCPYGMMPPGDPGQKALIFKKDKNTFEAIPCYNQGYKPETICDVNLKLQPSGVASGTLHIEFAGLAEYSWRGLLRHKTLAETEKKLVINLRSLFPGIVVQKISISDSTSLSTPLTADIEFQAPLYDPKSKNISIPLFYTALSDDLDVWKRNHAFELNEGYPDRFIQQIKITLPFKQKTAEKVVYQKNLPNFFSAQMETEFQSNELLKTFTIDLKNPNIPTQKLSELREALDAWTFEVHKPTNIQPE